ncbi:MAG: tRNA (5-methylaminomethyl-2-thiouridine)(34)-methyltransferase MnmD [Sterolibacterium sp.]
MLTPARLAYTPDGTPYSAEYDDVYHAAAGGLAQARHVFLGGNGLPERWRGQERFVILETGFGLGLNFLATWQVWRSDPQRCKRLHFVSFEKHPLTSVDLASLHRRWPELADLSDQLQRQWPLPMPGIHLLHFDEGRVILKLCFDDAAESLLQPALGAPVDAFFLDGFSPSKNPALWSPHLLKSLEQLAAAGATLATWTVAGTVRKGLAAAGFEVSKTTGFGNKREMLRGVRRR